MDQRRDVTDVVAISCFLSISNQGQGAIEAGFVFCAAVSIRHSDPKF